MDDINKGVYTTLCELGVPEIEQVQYCDDAFLRIKKAVMDGVPYDLMITDLFFRADHRKQKYPSGEALTEALRKEFPDLKIVVYSIEDRLQKVRDMMVNHKVNAYVCKGRNGLRELTEAVRTVHEGNEYLSPQVNQALHSKTDLEINDYDIELIKQLGLGLSQVDISHYLEQNNIFPSSLSSVEKRVNKLKDIFRANTPAHLVAIAKDMGLI